jgi:uncharacterized protein YjbI with pentapeptide repeats
VTDASLPLRGGPDDPYLLRDLLWCEMCRVLLSGRSAESVEFEQCRFRNADLGKTSLAKATFTDCLFENGNLANLRVEKSSMLRVRLSVLRMTGVHWIDGALRDVVVSECRADLTSFVRRRQVAADDSACACRISASRSASRP